MENIRINNREYSWGDIQVWVLGRPLFECRGIEYKDKKEKAHLHGAGRSPRAIQHGKRTPDGTLTLLQSGVDALNRAAREAGYKDMLDIEIDIVVSYVSETAIITTDKIFGASFSEMPKAMKEGDMQMEIALPFLCMDIQHGVI